MFSVKQMISVKHTILAQQMFSGNAKSAVGKVIYVSRERSCVYENIASTGRLLFRDVIIRDVTSFERRVEVLRFNGYTFLRMDRYVGPTVPGIVVHRFARPTDRPSVIWLVGSTIV